VIVALSFAVVHVQMGSIPPLEMLLLTGLGLFWSVFAAPLQKFLLTSAKRKFVRGWYVTEEVFHRLSGRITQEKDREAIFREVLAVLDEVFELENSLSVIATRDEQERFSCYRVAGQFQKIDADDPLIQGLAKASHSLPLADAADLQKRIARLGFRGGPPAAVLLPFHSPESLAGIIVRGDRSNQRGYSSADLKFFDSLISFISPILYRLTPME